MCGDGLDKGRIDARPVVEAIEGVTMSIEDGRQAEVDEVIDATGYDLDLPYLADDIRRARDGRVEAKPAATYSPRPLRAKYHRR